MKTLLKLSAVLSFFVLSPSPCFAGPAVSYFICKNTASGAIAIRASRCKGSEAKISNIESLRGPAGPAGSNGTNGVNGADGSNGTNGANGANGTNGTDGLDGTLRVYGDGSGGALSATSTRYAGNAPYQYTDITIDNGVTFTVASGTVLRCTGNFTNYGTIVVGGFASGGQIQGVISGLGTSPNISPASPGISSSVAAVGAYGSNAEILRGGVGGRPMNALQASQLLKPGPLGGGGGAAGISVGAGSGGGTLTVLCQGNVSNEGTITATGGNGSYCSGGGGGGIVILAAKGQVFNKGTIDVSGGDGGPADSSCGGGGGGGGGLIRLISTLPPEDTGTPVLDGGTAGSNDTSVSNSPRIAGGGGGSMVGSGGAGSDVMTNGVAGGNWPGEGGAIISSTADPTSLF